jgi:hypothetical protein
MQVTFAQEAAAASLLCELDRNPDEVILVPAPYQRFEGHMIRQRACRGPEFLELLRDKEAFRVRRDRLRRALLNISEGTYKDSRYYNLAMDLIKEKNNGRNQFSY